MPIPKELTVYVNVLSEPTDATYGDTEIIVPASDPNRGDFLRTCEEYFKIANRPDDADKFHQAAKQTPLDATDDGT